MMWSAGYSFWVPGRIKDVRYEADNFEKFIFDVELVDWGSQHGLPFSLGAPGDSSVLSGSSLQVLMPDEEGGIWPAALGHPSYYAAKDLKSLNALHKDFKSHKSLAKVPSPAVLVERLEDDRFRIGGHLRTLECKYLGAAAFSRLAARSKNVTAVLSKPKAVASRAVRPEDEDDSDEDVPLGQRSKKVPRIPSLPYDMTYDMTAVWDVQGATLAAVGGEQDGTHNEGNADGGAEEDTRTGAETTLKEGTTEQEVSTIHHP